jgi:hypothetical protein
MIHALSARVLCQRGPHIYPQTESGPGPVNKSSCNLISVPILKDRARMAFLLDDDSDDKEGMKGPAALKLYIQINGFCQACFAQNVHLSVINSLVLKNQRKRFPLKTDAAQLEKFDSMFFCQFPSTFQYSPHVFCAPVRLSNYISMLADKMASHISFVTSFRDNPRVHASHSMIWYIINLCIGIERKSCRTM